MLFSCFASHQIKITNPPFAQPDERRGGVQKLFQNVDNFFFFSLFSWVEELFHRQLMSSLRNKILNLYCDRPTLVCCPVKDVFELFQPVLISWNIVRLLFVCYVYKFQSSAMFAHLFTTRALCKCTEHRLRRSFFSFWRHDPFTALWKFVTVNYPYPFLTYTK